MTILLLGSGGREHALAWKISKSYKCSKLFVAPGNAGTATIATNVSINILDFEAIKAFTMQEKVEMIVVGPEDPLVHGIYDFLQIADRKTFFYNKPCAQIKWFCTRHCKIIYSSAYSEFANIDKLWPKFQKCVFRRGVRIGQCGTEGINIVTACADLSQFAMKVKRRDVIKSI